MTAGTNARIAPRWLLALLLALTMGIAGCAEDEGADGVEDDTAVNGEEEAVGEEETPGFAGALALAAIGVAAAMFATRRR